MCRNRVQKNLDDWVNYIFQCGSRRSFDKRNSKRRWRNTHHQWLVKRLGSRLIFTAQRMDLLIPYELHENRKNHESKKSTWIHWFCSNTPTSRTSNRMTYIVSWLFNSDHFTLSIQIYSLLNIVSITFLIQESTDGYVYRICDQGRLVMFTS